mgnify:CR=1 FL=1|jgi:IS5 family transposase|tara:strand:- start:25591 stop:25971 length:381 start_codon:yes stop_codon:yes gene_type:complete
MSHQLTFTDSELNNKHRKTRKEIFLSRMNELMPWDQLEAVIEPFYPKAGNGRRPYPLSSMFRIYCMQHWYNMSDPAMEDALYEITSMRLFTDLSLDIPITYLDSCSHHHHEFQALIRETHTLAPAF